MNDAPRHPRLSREWWLQEWREWRTTLVLIAVILACRSVFVDWYQVPSGSMQPSILIGDRIFVDRRAFDLRIPFTTISLMRTGEPRRGDVVVFWEPQTGERLVKRLIGLPGDVLEMRGQKLTINGQVLDYAAIGEFAGAVRTPDGRSYDGAVFEESLPGHPHPVIFLSPEGRGFGPLTVPADSYWMMGDNRDNSRDARWFGFVPRKLLAGRASRVIWSLGPGWEWRWSRFGERLP